MRNPSIFKTLVYSEPEAYAEPWSIQVSELPRGEHIQSPGIFRVLNNPEEFREGEQKGAAAEGSEF